MMSLFYRCGSVFDRRGVIFLGALAFAASPSLGCCVDPVVSQDVIQQIEKLAVQSTSGITIFASIALFTLISEDLACIAAGLLASQGIVSWSSAVAASAVGIYLGDILLYLTGYLVGISALQHAPLKWLLSEKTVMRSRNLFRKRGYCPDIHMSVYARYQNSDFFFGGAHPGRFFKTVVDFCSGSIALDASSCSWLYVYRQGDHWLC